ETFLNESINEVLLLQEAKNKGISVTDKEVSDTIKDIVDYYGISEEEFQQTLQQQGITTEFFEEYYRKQIMMSKLINETILTRIDVSDEEVAQYYETNKNSFIVPEQVNVSHILVNTTGEAEQVLNLLKKGDDFAELARQRSECTSAQMGGNLGYFQRGMMVKEFEDAAFSLEIGEISDIVESEFGYHIIKLHDKKPEMLTSLEDSALIIKENIKYEKQNDMLAEHLNELRENAKIEILYDFKEEVITN
ncbi:MAG: peptidylprolyl isomerase, partial [Candidatus Nanoarchaeia archaeon]|nr:peptidylprolyl isomerase [Candidatus Nanoarchaeia archaeon]